MSTEVFTPQIECGARAASCHCALPPGHDGAHECGRANCNGSWTGDIDGEDFDVIRFPALPGGAL